MALLTLLAATHQTLQSYVDPIFDRQILTHEFGQKIENWKLELMWNLVVRASLLC